MIALLIDIGNSRVKWRVASIGSADPGPHWLGDEHALRVDDQDAIDRAFVASASLAVDAIYVSNVAGADAEGRIGSSAARTWPQATRRTIVPSARQCGVDNGYRAPAQLGPDRWLALIGGHALAPDRSLLVCAFGTATTIDLLTVDGAGSQRRAAFVGGLILPGFDAMRAALVHSTARLPLAAGRHVDFGVGTDDAITSGIAAAQLGAVEHALGKAKMRSTRPVLCLLAGGGAPAIAPLVAELDVDHRLVHDLVLRGLAAVAGDDVMSPVRSTSNATP